MSGLRHLVLFLRLLVEDRQRLVLENVALRHQLAVLKRSVKRAKIQDSDRMFWILMKRMLADWRDAVHFVKPDTVVRWHRRGFRYYWRRKSRAKPGRPPISMAIILALQPAVARRVDRGRHGPGRRREGTLTKAFTFFR